MKHTIGLIVSLAIVTAGCDDKMMRPAAPDPVPTPARATTPDFTGTWVGVSRVISC